MVLEFWYEFASTCGGNRIGKATPREISPEDDSVVIFRVDHGRGMGMIRRMLSSLCTVLAVLCGTIAAANAQDGDVLLRIMASPAGFAQGPSLGYAFMCIELILANGVKEDCYGFYPKTGAGMFVGGPGLVQNEFQRNPGRFSNIAASDTDKITQDERRRILAAIQQFDNSNYSLTDSNCMDFVAQVVQLAGWRVPPRSPTQTPVEFVKAVAKLQNRTCPKTGC